MKYEAINWNEKNIDEVYDFYENLPENKKYSFFKWLYVHYPKIEFEWLDTFEELRFGMSYKKNIAACEEFVLWYSQLYPDEYSQRYEFIERDLCDYYFYTNKHEKLRQRIHYIAQNPVSGIDTITRRLFFQLLYHGMYDDAMQYAQQICQPLADDETLWGNPEETFIQAFFIDSFQKAYQHYKETGNVDFSEILLLVEKFWYGEGGQKFEIESKALQNAMNTDDILILSKTHPDDCVKELNVHFLKHMLDNHNISFVHSGFLWRIISVKDLFGKSKFSDDFFYIDAGAFEKSLEKRIDYSFGSNVLEMFGMIWALHYVYEFLESNNVISAEAAELMRENNLYHRNKFIQYINRDLWQMNFVFNWPSKKQWKNLKPLFDSTFDISNSEVLRVFANFNQNHPISERIENELKAAKNSKTNNIFALNDGTPFVKTAPDIGRNDPCPCGSGKKYKKCCMGKSGD